MFRKLKDRLAEEMKTPNRLQQLAQAAQAVVTSASSSISDVSNNDLFSIADEDTSQKSSSTSINAVNFHDVPLSNSTSPIHPDIKTNERQENVDKLTPLMNDYFLNTKVSNDSNNENVTALTSNIYPTPPNNNNSNNNNNRIRKLSNSSVTSDVSFRLPTYESPSGMFHIQSDLDVSASEIEDNVNVPAQLERVSKDHLYAAYRKTNEKYNKYRGRYTDLAKHYRNLERENAKAKAVLVETQDKALRRISELKEQCQLEQSAKAHLENALRLELDERNLKIESLNTKIKLLQSYSSESLTSSTKDQLNSSETKIQPTNEELINEQQLIDLSASESQFEMSQKHIEAENKHSIEIQSLNNKIVKLEQLLVKCKDTIKGHKEKNLQLNSEIQILSSELEKMKNENNEQQNKLKQLDATTSELNASHLLINDLKNEISGFENSKSECIKGIKSDLESAKLEILTLNNEIDMLKKREEENAISLAENKLSIHKELESKENIIKSLNESISNIELELKSKDIIITDLKHKLENYDQEKSSFNEQMADYNKTKIQINGMKISMDDLKALNQKLETKHNMIMEKLKCTELQLKQELDEKLAVIDRNNFLENRNKQLSDDNSNQCKQIIDMEKEILNIRNKQEENKNLKVDYDHILDKYNSMKGDYEFTLDRKLLLEEQTKSDHCRIEDLNQDIAKINQEKIETFLKLQKMESCVKELEIKCGHLESSNGNISSELKNLKGIHKSKVEEYLNKIEYLEKEISNFSVNPKEKELEENMQCIIQEKLNALEAELQNQYESKITKYVSMNEDFKTLNDKYDSVNEEKTKIMIELKELIETNDALKHEYEKIISEKTDLQNKYSESQNENNKKDSNINNMINEMNNLQKELLELQNSHSLIMQENENIIEKISEMEQLGMQVNENHVNSLKNENEKLNTTIEELQSTNIDLENNKHEIQQELSQVKQKLFDKEVEFKKIIENNAIWEMKLSTILDDNNTLQEKCGRLKQEKETILEKLSLIEQNIIDFNDIKNKLEEAKLEKEFLNMRVNQLDADKQKLLQDYDNLKNIAHEKDSKNNLCQEEIKTLKHNETEIKKGLKNYEEEKNKVLSKYEKELQEKESLIQKLKLHEQTLQNYEIMNSDKNDLETKILELLEKCDCIEKEKSDLVEKFSGEREQSSLFLQSKNVECEELVNTCNNLKIENECLNAKIKELECNMVEQSTIKVENNKLVYNEVNLINESSQSNNDESEISLENKIKMESDINELKQNNLVLLEKIKLTETLLHDLETQNHILQQENLKLSINSENQNKSKETMQCNDLQDICNLENMDEVNDLNEKYKNLVKEKNESDHRLTELERTYISNTRLLEQKNEKLGYNNEKLERRLDEALVSLNRIRTLNNVQENTELEYLRNILYEYLTGPTNNNMVLVKVLAAVVKFDHRQTLLVLEREKERQGILGQLGLL